MVRRSEAQMSWWRLGDKKGNSREGINREHRLKGLVIALWSTPLIPDRDYHACPGWTKQATA